MNMPALHLRGLATTSGDSSGLGYADLVTDARCAITVDNESAERPYQGIVAVTGDSLADSLEGYYLRSAQIPSHLALVADGEVCGGILLQQMPGRGEPVGDDWNRLGFLAATLADSDLENGVGTELIGKLFAEDDVRVFEPRDAVFRCRCSRERAANALKLLGPEECESAVEEDERVVVTCEYCGRRQVFDPVDIAQLFADDASAHHSGELH